MSSWEQNCKILKVSYNIIEKYVSLNFQLQILYLTWMFYGLEKVKRCHKKKKFGMTCKFCLDISRLYQDG